MFAGGARRTRSTPEALGFLLNSTRGDSEHLCEVTRKVIAVSSVLPLSLSFSFSLLLALVARACNGNGAPEIGSPRLADAHRQCRGLIIFSESDIPLSFFASRSRRCTLGGKLLTHREALTKGIDGFSRESFRGELRRGRVCELVCVCVFEKGEVLCDPTRERFYY